MKKLLLLFIIISGLSLSSCNQKGNKDNIDNNGNGGSGNHDNDDGSVSFDTFKEEVDRIQEHTYDKATVNYYYNLQANGEGFASTNTAEFTYDSNEQRWISLDDDDSIIGQITHQIANALDITVQVLTNYYVHVDTVEEKYYLNPFRITLKGKRYEKIDEYHTDTEAINNNYVFDQYGHPTIYEEAVIYSPAAQSQSKRIYECSYQITYQ